MGAKIEDDTQAKKGEIEAEPPEKKVKVSNAQDGDAKELKQRRTSYKRLGISEDEAEKLLKSEDANSGRRTRSRSRGVTESPRAAKKTTPAKETPSKRGPKGKKAAPAPAATSAEEDEEAPAEESTEKAEEAAKDDEPKEEEAAATEDGDDEAAAKEEEEDGDAAEPAKEESEEKDTDDGDAKKE